MRKMTANKLFLSWIKVDGRSVISWKRRRDVINL